jgi:hypothetical protein
VLIPKSENTRKKARIIPKSEFTEKSLGFFLPLASAKRRKLRQCCTHKIKGFPVLQILVYLLE